METICIGTALLNATTVVLPVEADKDSRSVVIIIIIIPALAVIDIIGGMVEVVEARCVMYHRHKRKFVVMLAFLSFSTSTSAFALTRQFSHVPDE